MFAGYEIGELQIYNPCYHQCKRCGM